MARETKVGLVVAASFLCLVGVVVAARLHQGGDEPKETPSATTKISVGKESQPNAKASPPAKPGELGQQTQKPSGDPSTPALPPAPLNFNGNNTPISLDPNKAASAAPPPFGPGSTATPDPNKSAVMIPNTTIPNSGLPPVKVTEVKKYTCEIGFTTFPLISKKLYNDEKYARALMEFNRAYAVKVEALQPGQDILFPPAEELIAKYSNLIGAAAAPASAIPVAPPATTGPGVSIRTVSPLTGTAGNPNNMSSAPPGSAITPVSNGPYKSYKVRDGGEHILLIAENTLGDRNRWPEIYRLNGTYNPNNPLPGGAVLQLPSNARVP